MLNGGHGSLPRMQSPWPLKSLGAQPLSALLRANTKRIGNQANTIAFVVTPSCLTLQPNLMLAVAGHLFTNQPNPMPWHKKLIAVMAWFELRVFAPIVARI